MNELGLPLGRLGTQHTYLIRIKHVDLPLVPKLRVENLEVLSGLVKNPVTRIHHAFCCCLVLVQKEDQSLDLPLGLLSLPSSLGRAGVSLRECLRLGRGGTMTDAAGLGAMQGSGCVEGVWGLWMRN